jgi:hypothetical protein
MSEEGGESRSVGAFLLGFLTGVLVCIGIGGGFFLVVGRQAAMQAELARRDAEVAHRHAEEQRARAEAEARLAEENWRKAIGAVKEITGNTLPKPKELVEEKESQEEFGKAKKQP